MLEVTWLWPTEGDHPPLKYGFFLSSPTLLWVTMEVGFSYKVYISQALTVASLTPFVYMNCGLWFGFFFTTLPKCAL